MQHGASSARCNKHGVSSARWNMGLAQPDATWGYISARCNMGSGKPAATMGHRNSNSAQFMSNGLWTICNLTGVTVIIVFHIKETVSYPWRKETHFWTNSVKTEYYSLFRCFHHFVNFPRQQEAHEAGYAYSIESALSFIWLVMI